MFVIPMAGLSSRFFKAGYGLPKYQLELPDGKSMFEWSLLSFKNYFNSDLFVFVVRDVFDTVDFVFKSATELGILNFEIVTLDRETVGQAETVYLGLTQSKKVSSLDFEPLYIFNIDSFRHEFIKPNWVDECDGYLEVFKGLGDHWSFVEVKDNKVIRTTEKERISEYCSDGLYYFKTVFEFNNLTKFCLDNQHFTRGELYIAPMYNWLIKKSSDIRISLIDSSEIDFCGTPEEYLDICKKLEGDIHL